MGIFNKQDRLNWSLASNIIYNAPAETFEKIIAKGADVNAIYKREYASMSMLSWAADCGRTEALRLLLAKGADPNPAGDRSETPLLRVVSARNLEAAKALIAAGAQVNVLDRFGETPLLRAMKSGSGDMAQLLVESGADINAKSREGNTALHFAAEKGLANLVRYLMEHGADVKAANVNMNTPADVAEKEYPRIADMIRGSVSPMAALISPEPVADDGWRKTADAEVARVSEKTAIGYRMTEIFNFSARLYTQIARNLETGVESQVAQPFSVLDAEGVEAAHAALVAHGGKAQPLDKKKLPKPE